MLLPHDKSTWHLKKLIIKRELDSKDKNAVTKQNNDNASGEIKIKVNGVIEETAEMLILLLF